MGCILYSCANYPVQRLVANYPAMTYAFLDVAVVRIISDVDPQQAHHLTRQARHGSRSPPTPRAEVYRADLGITCDHQVSELISDIMEPRVFPRMVEAVGPDVLVACLLCLLAQHP